MAIQGHNKTKLHSPFNFNGNLKEMENNGADVNDFKGYMYIYSQNVTY